MAEADLAIQDITRADVPSLRRTMRKLGVLIAEVDRDLRYVWIDNPHPDFKPDAAVGKRDDELIGKTEAAGLTGLKSQVLSRERATSRTLCFKRSDGVRCYNVSAYPVRNARGNVEGVVTIAFETQLPAKR